MVQYKCKICNYITNRKSDFTRHNETLKHINNKKKYKKKSNEEKKNQCEYCKKKFNHSRSKYKHYKTCDKKIKNDNSTVTIEKYNSVCEKIKNYENTIELYKSLLVNREKSITNIASAPTINFIVNTYINAPTLNISDACDYGFPKDKKYYDKLLECNEDGTIGEVLGDLIIKKHKKENPNDQSLWNTDMTRHTYYIKDIDKNGNSNWIIDKNGDKTREKTINPLIKHLKYVYYDENKQLVSKLNNLNNVNLFEQISKKLFRNQNFIKDIDNSSMINKILKYMNPRFHISNIS